MKNLDIQFGKLISDILTMIDDWKVGLLSDEEFKKGIRNIAKLILWQWEDESRINDLEFEQRANYEATELLTMSRQKRDKVV